MKPLNVIRSTSLRFWCHADEGSWGQALAVFVPAAALIALARDGFGLPLLPSSTSTGTYVLVAEFLGALVLIFYPGTDSDAWKGAAGAIRTGRAD